MYVQCLFFTFRYKYSRRIIAGLLLCCIGDALLIWPQYFLLGMIAFAVGHVNYIMAFGFKPLNLSLGLCLGVLNAIGRLSLYEFIDFFDNTFFLAINYFLPVLNGVLLPGVPIYSVILAVMVWRAIARVQFFEASLFFSFSNVFYSKPLKHFCEIDTSCSSVQHNFNYQSSSHYFHTN